MKVLIYSLNYAPEPTSTGKYTHEVASWLAARGHQVEVVCGLPHYPEWRVHEEYSHDPAREEILDGVRVRRAPHYVPNVGLLTTRARIRLETSFTMSAARYWLRYLLSRSKPNAVISVMPPMQSGVWPALYAWIRRVPWVLHIQDLQVDAAIRLNMMRVGRVGGALYAIEGFLSRRATRVSTITDAMRERIIRKGVPASRTWLLPNWADIEGVRPGPRENSFRRELAISTDTVVVLYAGNMGHKQGLDVVLEAASVCRNDQRLEFVLVGDGAARPRLEQRAAAMQLRNVRFLPVQPMKRLNEMLSAGDVHLVVQRREAADLVMPSKLTNILAAGRPCIATADPGTALYDVVHAHDTGEVIPPGDAAALVAAIRGLAADPARRAACGAHARAYAEQYLDRDRILSDFEAKLLTLCT